MKIQKFLAHAQVASRRKSEEYVQDGLVKVNGVKAHIGQVVDPDNDEITYKGTRVHVKIKKHYLLLNKPSGYVSTTSDPHGRRTIIDLIPSPYDKKKLYPVGRLDYESEGLILLTNDGDLAYRLTHPKFQVIKKYKVQVTREPSDQSLNKLSQGIVLDDGRTSPAKIVEISSDEDTTWLEISIHEGKKRQVRRMFEHIGHPVLRLIRTQIGHFQLGNLPIGKVRELSPGEYDRIPAVKK